MSDGICKKCGHADAMHVMPERSIIPYCKEPACDCTDWSPPAAPVERGEPDKVREALVAILDNAPARPLMRVLRALGLEPDSTSAEVASTLLALRPTPARESQYLDAIDAAIKARLSWQYMDRAEVMNQIAAVRKAFVATPAPSGEAEPWCWLVRSGATLRVALGAAFSKQDADRLLALADTEDARATLGPSRLVPLYAHPAAPQDGPQVTEVMLAFITGDLLLDVDACAMGSATETHYEAMARDLRERLARVAALTRHPKEGDK